LGQDAAGTGLLGVTVAQTGFLDPSDRCASLDARMDPPVEIDAIAA